MLSVFSLKSSTSAALGLALSLLSARAEVAENFEAAPAVTVEGNSHEETRCEVSEEPGKADNRALKLSWNAHSGTHVAGSLTVPGAVLFQDSGKYEITARVNLEQCPLEAQNLAIRVVDAGNETFQYSASIEKQGEPGWTEMKWIVNTNEPVSGTVKSWGDRVDEVMDFPVKFFGFAVDLKDWKTNGGTILFDDISVKKISE
jgi:hypothetical protein